MCLTRKTGVVGNRATNISSSVLRTICCLWIGNFVLMCHETRKFHLRDFFFRITSGRYVWYAFRLSQLSNIKCCQFVRQDFCLYTCIFWNDTFSIQICVHSNGGFFKKRDAGSKPAGELNFMITSLIDIIIRTCDFRSWSKKMCLPHANASVRLVTIQEFHL